jgi:integrase/recombinase XerD
MSPGPQHPRTLRPIAAQRPANAGRQLPPESVSPVMVAKLMAAASGSSTRARRDRLALALAYYGGLRSAELVAIRPEDVDRFRGLLHVVRGKGNRPRSLWLDPELLPFVDEYLGCRDAGDTAPLLVTSTGMPMLTSHLRRLLKRLARVAGIASARGLHVHALRHGAARRWMDGGLPLHVVQAALGHADAQTTLGYVARVAPEEMPGWGAKLVERLRAA